MEHLQRFLIVLTKIVPQHLLVQGFSFYQIISDVVRAVTTNDTPLDVLVDGSLGFFIKIQDKLFILAVHFLQALNVVQLV